MGNEENVDLEKNDEMEADAKNDMENKDEGDYFFIN